MKTKGQAATGKNTGKPDRTRLSNLLDFLPDPVFFFTLDNTVEYINPAFENVFGWTLEEVKGANIRFVPQGLVEQAREGLRDLYRYRSVHDFETRRYTKGGKILDVRINASLIHDDRGRPLGHVMVLRDITAEKQIEAGNQAMFRISQALHAYRELSELIDRVNQEIKAMVGAEGSFILLADEEKDQLFFYAAQYRDGGADGKFKEIRFPAGEGVSGRVYRTGQPMMIPDVSQCDFFLTRVDDESGMVTRNMLSVPITLKKRTIGVISLVNKSGGDFTPSDTELLGTVAGVVALPIENARMHEELKRSHQNLKTLNHAKDKVINHLAHEMKTPAAVLDAAMKLLVKRLASRNILTPEIEKIVDRARRNLDRLLDIQYETQDLLKEEDFRPRGILTRLVDACRDELAVLVQTQGAGIPDPGMGATVWDQIQAAVDGLFGPRDISGKEVRLHDLLPERIKALGPDFKHRRCRLSVTVKPVPPIRIPEGIPDILITGLLRNGFEYTPNEGKIHVRLQMRKGCPELVVKDFGVGFTKEKMKLVFENFFAPPDSTDYATKHPFDFNAGGRGFDLLRMQIFAEKYDFSLDIQSDRCRFIPGDTDLCPGDIRCCPHCRTAKDCFASGGTTVRVRFHCAR